MAGLENNFEATTTSRVDLVLTQQGPVNSDSWVSVAHEQDGKQDGTMLTQYTAVADP